MSSTPRATLGVLWGKSDPHTSLLQHLLDTAAVAERIWDGYLAPAVRDRLDTCSGGRGRSLLALLCGLHDLGKATPAFQDKVPPLADAVRATGLHWRSLSGSARSWHHPLAGALIARTVLSSAGWDTPTIRWVWPLIAGHHGMVPGADAIRPPTPDAHGRGPAWGGCQHDLVHAVAEALGLDLTTIAPTSTPRRADQLAILGAIIMADWIASGPHFPGVDRLADVSMDQARQRADDAWGTLGLRGGWSRQPYRPVRDLIRLRFGQESRPFQESTVALATTMPAPGLLIIEAPTGEGKTEAALAAAEILARRFGADGVFVGMPTQATSDPMFTRVHAWAQRIEPGTPVGLLHGKRRFNRQWRELLDQTRCNDVDTYGTGDDEYGLPSAGRGGNAAPEVPAEWFLGPKRGLLMPVTIGTIDQLLHAATRTRHVMLRHTGLAGRVVILDEVHAYDVYMTQFLTEALRWLADAGVPVILLSATLPPDTRMVLARAYLQGATQRTAVTVPPEMAEDTGYPVVRSLSPGEGQPRYAQLTAAPWRDPLTVAVDVLDEDPEDGSSPTGPSPVVTLLRRALSEGGCALVIRNTVGRAQQTYREIRASFGPDEVVLLHARLVVGARATRTEWALDRLGPPGHSGKPPRPRRLVVVATQLAEQSFDVDVDLLVTDLAPIDLLLQRVGRLHRHHRPPEARPAAVRAPAVVVTGMRQQPDAPPTFPRGSEYVYGRYPLLRAASLVIEATAPEAGSGWSVPDAVPALVRRGYDDAEPVPPSWRPAVDDARKRWHEQQKTREGKAEKFLLAGEKNLGRATLDGLHDIAMADLTNEDAVAAVVRDGPETVEVVLVRRDGDRGYLTLDGHHIDTAGAAVSVPEVAEAVAQSAVRLPPRPAVTTAAKDLLPLPECGDDPWLRRARVLVLDEARSAVLGGRRFTYDPDYGLLDETEAPDAAPRPRPGVFRNHPRSDSGGLVVN